jgi:G:T/U-mismatch repair DNA glycosylase
MTEHLFKHTDLEPLENHPLKGEYEILIVGTFNGDIKGNLATWFYGRPENEFWCLFPRMLGRSTLYPVDREENVQEFTNLWKHFSKDNKVIIDDVFKDIIVDLPKHLDKNLAALQPHQYIAFDFQKAFANCKFERLMFTWKEMVKNSALTILKVQNINIEVIKLYIP